MDAARRKELALTIVRVALAATMIIHGAARINAGGVAPFGEFLTGVKGFPFGLYLAWGITIFELVGGALLALGYFVPVIALVFAFQLMMGIVLVHWPEGWFVVGLGRNGMEYSAVLIVSFLATALANFEKTER